MAAMHAPAPMRRLADTILGWFRWMKENPAETVGAIIGTAIVLGLEVFLY